MDCLDLEKIIQDPALWNHLDLQEMTRLPTPGEVATLSIQLVLLQTSSGAVAAEGIQSLRRFGYAGPIFWLFCRPSSTHLLPPDRIFQITDDFLFCPFQGRELTARIQKCLAINGSEFRADTSRDGSIDRKKQLKIDLGIGSLVGQSPAFIKVVRQIPQLARYDATVLLSGETGTGKELAARAIHYLSPRSGGPFIPVNCAALPDHLLENELFGHTKGAYTDASAPQAGLVAEAETGTLFLDEIDGLSLSSQSKVLRFLQEREYRPLGGKALRANTRIIAAANSNLAQKMKTGQFREDLYFRLHTLSLTLPPLRERREDISPLAQHFLKQYCRDFRCGSKRLSSGALFKLCHHEWPGNVRELQGVIQRAIVLSSGPVIQAEEIDLPVSSPSPHQDSLSFQSLKRQAIDAFEKTYLSQLLSIHQGNVSRAAKEAGKDRRAFRRLMEKHGLIRQHFVSAG